ncbi:hypothetical protein M3G00_00570 [Brevibacterium casei]|uniref:Uncharacterized protein n=1 Tax=Brevibacterium casei TaxID=33889 RepID=A0AB34XTL4_9MICO|nr:hypothetical protein [Brevibacterium casei]KZE22275.1 hypothetical protein AVW13_08315 [Brevibacterium casei]MCT2181428.1 hypothetical protein [Brevibacterium casei]MCT2357542.1 hypothetical protein [Brevibacterium casei]SIH96419.1 Uncharacterised protein [Mycobacteroides abscessus subsp. abscessus]
MTSKFYTVLLGATALCAWGSLAEIVKALLRQQPVAGAVWTVLVIAALGAVGVWLFYRSKGVRPEVKAFIGSIPQGAALLCIYVFAFVLPGFSARGADVVDLAFTAIVAAAVVWFVLYLLRKRYFTPPDSPEGL